MNHNTHSSSKKIGKLQKALIPIVFLLTGVFIILLLSVSNARADWTMMVYLCGDNDLEDYAIDDLDEIMDSEAGDVDVLVLMDYNETEDGDTKLYHILNGTTTELSESWVGSEMNMGDEANLTAFVDWALTDYPSSNTMLVFWDHGGSWYGCCWDDHTEVPDTGDNLEIREICNSLDSALDPGETIDIIGFTACLMASTEVAYELSEYGEYLVGAEPVGWMFDGDGYNWDFDHVIEYMNTTSSAYSVASEIVDNALDLKSDMEYASHSWSATDLDDMPSLVSDIDAFSSYLISTFPDHYVAIAEARMDSEEYISGETIDLYHFAENIQGNASLPSSLRNAAQDVMTSVQVAVIAEEHWTGTDITKGSTYTMGSLPGEMGGKGELGPCYHSNGLSIFFPLNTTKGYSSYDSSNNGVKTFTDDTMWDEWLDLFTSYIFVDDSNTGFEDGCMKYPFDTIEEALDVASNDDVIIVFAGSYAENVEIETRVTLLGNGTDSVINPSSGEGVYITTDDVVLNGFKVTTGTGGDNILVKADDVTISNCALDATGSAGLHFLYAKGGVVEYCSIGSATGSGIQVAGSEDIVIGNSTIEANGNDGIGIYFSDTVDIHFCQISDNTDDGILTLGSPDVTVNDCDIYDNGDLGIYVTGSSGTVDARFNYWGHMTGPGGEGPGIGDEISKDVHYSPWLGYYAGYSPHQLHFVDTTGLIQDAVDHALAADYVYVYNGTYTENVHIKKTLTLSGYVDSPPYPVIFADNFGDAVYITAPGVRVQRFTILTGSSGDNDIHIGSGDSYADYTTISECNLSTSGSDALYLDPDVKYSLIIDCYIHDAGANGVLFDTSPDPSGGWNTIKNTLIYDSGACGVEVGADIHDILVSHCEIFENTEDGVLDQGEDTEVLNSTIRENGMNGVLCSQATNTFVKWCRILDNGDHGVYADTGSTNTDARFNYWGHWSGPDGDGPGSGDELNAKVHYSPWLGFVPGTEPMSFYVDPTGLIQDAVDHAQDGDSIRLIEGYFTESILVDRRVTITGNGSAGTTGNNSVVEANGHSPAFYVTADGVNISRTYVLAGTTGDHNLVVRADHVRVTNCYFGRCQESSLYFIASDFCRVENCEIEDAGKDGINFSAYFSFCWYGSDDNVVENCSISDCGQNGVLIGDHCQDNNITGCEIYDNGKAGTTIVGDDNMVHNCWIHGNSGPGVFLNTSSLSKLQECNLSGNGEHGAYLLEATRCTISFCEIAENVNHGVWLSGSDRNTISGTEIHDNGGSGIYLISSLRNKIDSCEIYSNTGNGITGGILSNYNKVTGSDIYSNSHGIYLFLTSNWWIRGNTIEKNSNYGVYAATFCSGTDARYNYWGHSSGPGGAGPGFGDEVTSNVLYSPWLLSV